MAKRAKRIARIDERMGFPKIEDEPSLEEWLAEHHAELVWKIYSKGKINGVPALLIACYRFPNGRSALITIGAHGVGWDIATTSGSTEIDRVLGDAEIRLGL